MTSTTTSNREADAITTIENVVADLAREVAAATAASTRAGELSVELERVVTELSESRNMISPHSLEAVKQAARALQEALVSHDRGGIDGLRVASEDVEELVELLPLAVKQTRRQLEGKGGGDDV
jgi:hypothetical protein